MSVALCTYNGAHYLEQQLKSILDQVDLPDEVVVCDDRSSDTTALIVSAFAEVAPFPVRFLHNPETLRPAQNFNRCISLCTGDIIVLSDQDDLWSSTRIASTRAAFEKNPALTFTFSDAPLIDLHGLQLGRTIYSSVPVSASDRNLIDEGTQLLPVLLRWGVIYGATMAFRANLRDICLPIPPLWSHDEWIALTLSARGPSSRLSPVISYRQHAAQQVGTGRWTFRTRVANARARLRDHYMGELARFSNAIAEADRNPELRLLLLPHLLEKYRFLVQRSEIHATGPAGLLLLIRLGIDGQYRQYAGGTRSWFKDLSMILRTVTSG